MSEMYKSLTDFLPKLEDDKSGDWMIDRINDGTLEHPIQMQRWQIQVYIF